MKHPEPSTEGIEDLHKKIQITKVISSRASSGHLSISELNIDHETQQAEHGLQKQFWALML